MNFRTPYNYKKASPTYYVCEPLVEVLDFDTKIEPNNVKSTDNKGVFTNNNTPVSPFPQSAVSLDLNPREVANFYNKVMQQDSQVKEPLQKD